jgi:hypothetical protein
MDDAYLLDEDRHLRQYLAELGSDVLQELYMVLVGPQTYRDKLKRRMIARPDLSELAQVLALVTTDEAAKLRLLRALRDLGCT